MDNENPLTNRVDILSMHIDYLYNPNQSIENINKAKAFLCSYIKIDYLPQLKNLLVNPTYPHTKIYAANGLTELITQYYLTIPPKTIEYLYTYLLTYLFSNCDSLLETKSKLLLSVLIKLLCRLIRVNWLNISSLKNIYHDVVSNTKEDFISSLMMPFPIFTELIYQFQSFDLPPKHKLKKITTEFKESTLLPIYDYSIQELLSLFQHDIMTERLEEMFIFIDEVIKCLMECLEYDDDINAKENYYSKYEIKPSYIPNNKKRLRDKTLDIDLLETLIQNLFDTHTLLIKAGSKYISDQCLLFLQKLIAMKIIYLGDRKYLILKLYQNGICNILFNKHGFIHHEQLCRLIYYSKKNYSVNDLLMNEHYLNYLFTFTQETINNECFFDYLTGFVYLLRFFAYLSFGIERIPYSIKSTVKNFVITILTTVINKGKDIFGCNKNRLEDLDEDLLKDLIKTFGLCGYCSYESLLQTINGSFDLTKNNDLNAFNCNAQILQYGVSLMKAKYRLFSEPKMINKSTENETMIDDIHLTELIPTEVSETVTFISNGFTLIKSIQSHQSTTSYSINMAALSFIKLFSKYFLNQHLPNKFIYIYQQITQILQLNIPAEILSVIIDSLVLLCQRGTMELNQAIKIIQIIESNCFIEYERNNSNTNSDSNGNNSNDNSNSNNNCGNSSKVQIGKLYLTSEFLPRIQRLINEIVAINPIEKGKARKLLLSSTFYIYSMIVTYEEALYQFLLQFNYDKILNNDGNDNELLYAINSASALLLSSRRKLNYEILIEKITPLIELFSLCFCKATIPNRISIPILKLFQALTYNSYCRISFKSNSECPYKLFKLSKEILDHYYSSITTLNNSSNTTVPITTQSEKYLNHIKPISLLIRLFSNLFNGQFIQISVIVNAEPNTVKDVFKKVYDLILTINFEDLFGYLSKFKGIYEIMKIMYCDYPKCANINETIIKNILLLFNEGIDSNDEAIINHIYTSICEWGFSYLSLMQNKDKGLKESYLNTNKELVLILFEKFSTEMQGLLLKLFNILLNNEFGFIESMSKAILVLGLIYNEYYNQMTVKLVEMSQLSTTEKNTMNDSFKVLFSRVQMNINSNGMIINSNGLLNLFNEDLTIFGLKIKDIYSNHSISNTTTS